MPCPEKFKETMVTFGIPKEIIDDINTGFENTISSSPKKEKAEYFKTFIRIIMKELMQEISPVRID